MKKFLCAAATLAAIGFTSTAQAQTVNVCVFDLLGKSGDAFKMAEDWKLAAKSWGADINLLPRQDERVAEDDFKAGQCDGVFMTAMRGRTYNKFVGSIDSLGGIPNRAVAQKVIPAVLSPKLAGDMVKTIGGKKYEVAGITPLGAAYIFVRDKNINNIKKAAGKKFAVLSNDKTQEIMVEQVGAQAIKSEISNFAAKFNNGAVDIIGAPAYAYKPLEIEKGIKANGAMFNFPVLYITGNLIIRPEKFPEGFGQKSRAYHSQNLKTGFDLIAKLEGGIPAKYKLNLAAADKLEYEKMLYEGSQRMVKEGYYDARMVNLLKSARCSVSKTYGC